MKHAEVPELPRGCGSWIVECLATGEAVCEVYSRQLVARVDGEKFRIHTALAWLQSLNNRIVEA